MQAVGEAGRIAERDQVPARHLIRLDAESVAGDAALEPGWEEPVAGADQHPDRDVRPVLEGAWLPEGGVGWLAWRPGGCQHGPGPGRQVMQEIGLDVELTAAAGRLVGCPARLPGSGSVRPLTRSLAGFGDHRVQQDDHRDRPPDHGRGESGQRLRDQHHAGLAANRPIDDLSVFREAKRRVVLRDVHRDRPVTPPPQLGHKQPPIRGLTAGAWHQHERGHRPCPPRYLTPARQRVPHVQTARRGETHRTRTVTGEPTVGWVTTTRELLLAERALAQRRAAALEREFADIAASAGEPGADDEHDPEGATLAFERQHTAGLLAQAVTQIAEIDAAIGRLDDGTYGICVRCGQPVGAERLAARPAAATCVRCAQSARPLLARLRVRYWSS